MTVGEDEIADSVLLLGPLVAVAELELGGLHRVHARPVAGQRPLGRALGGPYFGGDGAVRSGALVVDEREQLGVLLDVRPGVERVADPPRRTAASPRPVHRVAAPNVLPLVAVECRRALE